MLPSGPTLRAGGGHGLIKSYGSQGAELALVLKSHAVVFLGAAMCAS